MKIIAMAAVFLLMARPAAAGLESVTVQTDDPTAGEAIDISVQGILHDSCWTLEGHSVSVGDGIIYVNVSTLIVDGGCLQYVSGYTVDVQVTVPTAGEWVVRVVENHVTQNVPPIPDYVLEISVTVSAPVEADATSLSAIKALFR